MYNFPAVNMKQYCVSGMEKYQDPGSVIRDEHPGSYSREVRKQVFRLKIPKFFDGIRNLFDPGSGMKKFGSGNRDTYLGSATLI